MPHHRSHHGPACKPRHQLHPNPPEAKTAPEATRPPSASAAANVCPLSASWATSANASVSGALKVASTSSGAACASTCRGHKSGQQRGLKGNGFCQDRQCCGQGCLCHHLHRMHVSIEGSHGGSLVRQGGFKGRPDLFGAAPVRARTQISEEVRCSKLQRGALRGDSTSMKAVSNSTSSAHAVRTAAAPDGCSLTLLTTWVRTAIRSDCCLALEALNRGSERADACSCNLGRLFHIL